MPSLRTFYKSTISFTILSEQPIPQELSIQEILDPEADEDGYIFVDSQMIASAMTPMQIVQALGACGLDPQVFGLDDAGEDLDE